MKNMKNLYRDFRALPTKEQDRLILVAVAAALFVGILVRGYLLTLPT